MTKHILIGTLVLTALTGCEPECNDSLEVNDIEDTTDTLPEQEEVEMENCAFTVTNFQGQEETYPTRAYVENTFELRSFNVAGVDPGANTHIYAYTTVSADACGGVILTGATWKMLSIDQNDVDLVNLTGVQIGKIYENYEESLASADTLDDLSDGSIAVYEKVSYMGSDGMTYDVPDDQRLFTEGFEYGLYIPAGQSVTLVHAISIYAWTWDAAAEGDELRLEMSSIDWAPADSDEWHVRDVQNVLPAVSDPLVF